MRYVKTYTTVVHKLREKDKLIVIAIGSDIKKLAQTAGVGNRY